MRFKATLEWNRTRDVAAFEILPVVAATSKGNGFSLGLPFAALDRGFNAHFLLVQCFISDALKAGHKSHRSRTMNAEELG